MYYKTKNKILKKSDKSRIVTFILAYTLGYLGIHDFYLGYNKKGVKKLLMTILLAWTFVVPIVIYFRSIITGIQALLGKITDANGRALA